MRPTRLELQGFASFRDPTEVSFDGADLFALVGPTGAGKSSLIDAVTFALFGSAARHGKGEVAPLMTSGAIDMRVRLDFEVAGVPHSVVRVARRRATQVSVREARLERGEEVLAGDVRGVNREVVRLLGLEWDQFTKCVVLPQGAFARFLNDKPSDRQDLLVKLLDLGAYAQMATLARQRADQARLERDGVDERLAELADADEAALAGAVARREQVAALREAVAAEVERLDEMRSAANEAKAVAASAKGRLAALSGVAVPEEVAGLAAAVRAASEAVVAARAEVAAAEEAETAAHDALSRMRAEAEVRALIEAHDELAAARAELEELEVRSAALSGELVGAAEAVAAAEAALAEAREASRQIELAHRAHALVGELEVGSPCPVCEHVVSELPSRSAPAELADAAAEVSAAEGALRAARARHAGLDRDASAASARIDPVRAHIADLSARVERDADVEALRSELEAVSSAARASAAARARLAAARREASAAQEALEAAEKGAQAAEQRYEDVRRGLAEMAPPSRPTGADIADAWDALVAWAAAEVPAAVAAAEAAEKEADRIVTEGKAAADAVVERCRAAGVEVASRSRPMESVVAELTRAEGEVDRVKEALAKAGALRERREALAEREQVARELGRLLGAQNFEAWVLEEVVRGLAARASEHLVELSSGQFSLALRDGSADFDVVDHRDADQLRSARTLSGGETFLTSLALALALADQVRDLAAGGAAQLESLFVDEGFGTLDPDTLDVVAATMEHLGQSGRMVGLVTHVRELAERVPTRFEVLKGPAGSTVRRVDL